MNSICIAQQSFFMVPKLVVLQMTRDEACKLINLGALPYS